MNAPTRRRTSGGATHGGGGGQVVSPGQSVPVLDQGLEKLAHFTLEIGERVAFGTRAGYDQRTHKYKDSFVNPTKYRFFLSARDGVNAFANRTIARRRSMPTIGSRLGNWLDDRDHDVAPLPPGAGIPDWLNAYVWTVAKVGGGFSTRRIVRRPIAPMELASIDVPEPGTYDIELRVVTDDNRYFERTMRVTFRAWFVASMGDSSASGEGNPMVDGDSNNHSLRGWPMCQAATMTILLNTVTNKVGVQVSVSMADKPEWLERKAHRSLISGPAYAAQGIENRVARTVRGRIHSLDVITFVTVARSGAEIRDGLLAPQHGQSDFAGAGQIAELQRAANGRTVDILMLNIGGNDAGFSTVLSDMVGEDSVLKPSLSDFLLMALLGLPVGGDDAAERRKIRDRLEERLKAGGEIEKAFDDLESAVNGLVTPGTGKVYVTGYPIWLFDSEVRNADGAYGFRADGIFSGPDMDVTNADYRLIIKQGSALNNLIERKASDFNWIYVEPSTEFQGRGYASKASFWRGATSSCDTQGDFDGVMHPTAAGHGAWALQFIKAIKNNSM